MDAKDLPDELQILGRPKQFFDRIDISTVMEKEKSEMEEELGEDEEPMDEEPQKGMLGVGKTLEMCSRILKSPVTILMPCGLAFLRHNQLGRDAGRCRISLRTAQPSIARLVKDYLPTRFFAMGDLS